MTSGDAFEAALSEHAAACRARGDEASAEQISEMLEVRRRYLHAEQRLAEAGQEKAKHDADAELARLDAGREALA
jgi:hypothetical protein